MSLLRVDSNFEGVFSGFLSSLTLPIFGCASGGLCSRRVSTRGLGEIRGFTDLEGEAVSLGILVIKGFSETVLSVPVLRGCSRGKDLALTLFSLACTSAEPFRRRSSIRGLDEIMGSNRFGVASVSRAVLGFFRRSKTVLSPAVLSGGMTGTDLPLTLKRLPFRSSLFLMEAQEYRYW